MEATDGEVGVLEGWGGVYMLDLIPAGICGVMPGLGVSDLLALVPKYFSLQLRATWWALIRFMRRFCLQIVFSPAAYRTVPIFRKVPAGSARDFAGSGCPPADAQAGRKSRGSHLNLKGQVLALLDRA